MKKKDVFTAKEICQILGIYIKTLAYWVKKRTLKPSVYDPSGRGTVRLFNSRDVFRAALIRDLTQDKFPLDFIRQILDFFDERQIIEGFWDSFSVNSTSEIEVYLISATNYEGKADFMDLVEVAGIHEYHKLGFGDFERVLIFNLTLLCDRIREELDDLEIML